MQWARSRRLSMARTGLQFALRGLIGGTLTKPSFSARAESDLAADGAYFITAPPKERIIKGEENFALGLSRGGWRFQPTRIAWRVSRALQGG